MSRLRRAAVVVAVPGLACALVALGLRWVDTTLVPVVVVQSALPLVALACAALTLLLAAVRAWRPAAAGLALSLALAGTGLPAIRTDTVPPADDDLVVVSANLRYGEADPGALMGHVRALDADVVVLVEVTPQALSALDAAGLGEWTGSSGIALPGAAGIVVRSRDHLDSIDWGPQYPEPWQGAVARVETARGPVVVRGAHPSAPNLHDAATWRASLAEYATWAQERHQDEPVVIAGDLNSGYGHPAFRDLARGYTDAHRAAGRGWVRTWPTQGLLPAFTQLDHVLVRGLDVVDAGSFEVPGTDHAAVWARLHRR